MKPVKALLHVHTDYSFDSDTSAEALVRAARQEGIGCIAVTDHDTIDGALHVAAIADMRVIIGEEVSTRDGHLIGLFLNERIRPGMSARDTAIAIRDQGGLVLAPHPFVRFGGCGLGRAIETIADLLDAVEVCNGQNLSRSADRAAAQFAEQHGIAKYVGSDTHSTTSIAPCYQLMAPFSDRDGFLASLQEATLQVGRHSLSYFAAAAARTARYMLTGAMPAGFGANHRAGEHTPAPGHPAYAAAD